MTSNHKYFKRPPSKSRGGNPRDLAPIRIGWDTLNSEYAPRQHALTAPPVGIFDAPYTCLKINRKWLSHVAGMIEVLTELDAWTGDDDGYLARQEIEKLLAALEDDCEDIPMSCCEDLIIELQQVKNEVVNIRNTVNYYNSDTTTILNDYSQLINTYNNSIDVVLDIAPDAKTPGLNRDLATCAAISLYVDSYVEYSRDVLSATQSGIQIAGLVLAGAAAFFTAGGSIALWLAISGGIAAAGTVVTGLPIAILDDESAREEVKCCLYGRLEGKEPTLANFLDAFNHDCDLSANATIIMEFVRSYTVYNDAAHAAYLEKLQEQIPYAELGLLAGCGCGEPITLYWRSLPGVNHQVAQVDSKTWDLVLSQGVNTGFVVASLETEIPYTVGGSERLPNGMTFTFVAGNSEPNVESGPPLQNPSLPYTTSGDGYVRFQCDFGASQRAIRVTANFDFNVLFA